jgi:hypothetical protein
MGALSLWPQATATGHGKKLVEFGRNTFVPATGDQRNQYHYEPCQRELSAAGKALIMVRSNRPNEVEEQCEQSLIKVDRSCLFFGSSCLSWFNCQCMNTLMRYPLIRLRLKSTALTGALPERRRMIFNGGDETKTPCHPDVSWHGRVGGRSDLGNLTWQYIVRTGSSASDQACHSASFSARHRSLSSHSVP